MQKALASLMILVYWLAPAAVRGQEVGKDWMLEPLEWSSPVEHLETITVTNIHGAVRIGGTSGELAEIVELHGMVQRHTDDPRQPEVVREIRDGTASIEVKYPGDAEVAEPPDAWRKRRIDVTVYVDKTTRLRVETLHGAIVIKGFAGPIDAVSESGKIQIKTEGPVDAISKYGEVETFFTGAVLPASFELETVSGPIHLSLPWRANPRALLETRGEISSDYSIGIEWLPDSTLKRGTVDAGSTAELVVLRSNQGNIRLLRRIDDRRSPPSASSSDSLNASNSDS